MSEICDLRIWKGRAQRLVKIEQSIIVVKEHAELHIKRTWRDLEKQLIHDLMIKTESGWRSATSLVEPEIIKSFPEDTVEIEVVDVTQSNVKG